MNRPQAAPPAIRSAPPDVGEGMSGLDAFAEPDPAIRVCQRCRSPASSSSPGWTDTLRQLLLVHTNRRRDGAWTQRYEHGIPVTDLVSIPGSSATGTTVQFRPDETVRAGGAHAVIDAVQLAASSRELSVESPIVSS